MTHKLPPNLLALFAARPALRYLPASDHAPEERTTSNISGIGQFLGALEEYRSTVPYEATESWLQKKERLKAEKREKTEAKQKIWVEKNGSNDPNVRGDAFKTLFVARLSYDTKEKDLEREFGRFGPIERIRIVKDESEVPEAHENGITGGTQASKRKKKKIHRGYAFVVYEREKDMKAAYKETDGIRIKDRRVLVDVERGRTVKGWRPRRLGGGLGGRGYTKTAPQRPLGGAGGFAAPAGPGGGFGGGFRGGPRSGPGGGGGGGGGGGFRSGGGFRGGERGGYGGGRGGIGYQGGGGFGGGGGGGGGRGGYGGGPNGYGAPPNAPSGPGSRGAFGGGNAGSPNGGMNGDGPRSVYGGDRGRGGHDDDRRAGYGGGGGGRYGDRPSGGFTGSNSEPVGQRRDDRDRGYGRGPPRDDYDRPSKRPYDGGYDDDPRKRRY